MAECGRRSRGAGDRQDFMDTLLCPKCGAQLKNPGGPVGQDLQCPRCKAVFSGKDGAETKGTSQTEAGERTGICEAPNPANSAVCEAPLSFDATVPILVKPLPKPAISWIGCSLYLGVAFIGLGVTWFIFERSLLVTTKEDRARMDTRSLQTIVMTFYARQNAYPKALEELTELQSDGSPPLMDEKGLIDPWGNPYNYDPNSRHPKTDRPLIYSNGPPGQNKRISNWD
jgi:hypothetical protein